MIMILGLINFTQDLIQIFKNGFISDENRIESEPKEVVNADLVMSENLYDHTDRVLDSNQKLEEVKQNTYND